MHSVPHADRLELDGTWRFQLLDRPDADPAATWGEITVPGVWTMQGTADEPHYTNVQMPFPDLPPHVPDDEPDRGLRADLRAAGRLAGRRVVLHVGAAESVLIVRLNGRRRRHQQGLPPRGRVRRDRGRPARRRTRSTCGRQVVRRDVRRGPGPVVARRHHPLGVPVRDRPGPSRRRPGRSAGLADDLTTGTLDLRRRRRRSPAASRARLDRRGAADGMRAPLRGRAPARTRRRRRAGRRSADLLSRHVGRRCPRRRAGRRLGGAPSAARAARRRPARWQRRVPDVARGRREEPHLHDPDGRPPLAGRRGRRAGELRSASGGSRSSGWTCSSTASGS